MTNVAMQGVTALILTACLAAPASAADRVEASLMWKGEELWPCIKPTQRKYAGRGGGWRSMSGIQMYYSYSGNGPLPPPEEVVIPLEKTLPIGVYRLFVMNYRFGKMEATVGDVTKSLTVRRHDWTPGEPFETNAPVDKIILRYFPNVVADNGAKQEANQIVQGVFLTTDVHRIPIEDQIVNILPKEKPAVKEGNYLQNASFEVGLFPWGKPFGVSAAYDLENLDSSTAVHGRHSFKLTLSAPSGAKQDGGREAILESMNYRLAPGPYTLSFHAKADKPVSLQAALIGATEDLKKAAEAGLEKQVNLTSRWQRYSATGDLKALAGFLYTVHFSIKSSEPATVWIDGIQLQSGALTEYQPAAATEVGYTCSTLANLFYEGQGSDADLLVYDTSGSASTAINYQVFDYWGAEIDKGQKQVPISDNAGKLTLSLPAEKRGLFRVLFSMVDGANSEMVYSVLPPNTHLDTFYPEGTLGVDAHFNEKQLAILKRANFNWINSKHIARWYLIEKEEGKYIFNDEAIALADRAKMTVLLQPLNIDWGMQEWLKPYWKPEGKAAWELEKKEHYFKKWDQFLDELVNHFKGSVKHWEIENEPFYQYSHDEYAELLEVAVTSIRKADPEAKIVAFAGGGYSETGYNRVLELVDPTLLDAFSVHFYPGNSLNVFYAYAEMLEKYNKPGWNSETGINCPTSFTTLVDYDTLWQKDYLKQLQDKHRARTIVGVHNYLTSLSIGGMERYFYYFCRFVNCSPSQPTRRHGLSLELVEFDGSLRGTGVGLSIASHFIDGSRYQGPVKLHERLQMHVYGKGDTSVGFCWGKADEVLTVAAPDGISFFDIMGNPIQDKTLRINDSPVYFTFKGKPQACAELLSGVKIASEPGIPPR